MLRKTSGDLGDRNIPKPLIIQEVPGTLKALWWREESENPELYTIEIWSNTENEFYVISGNFTDGEWGQQDIELVGTYENIDSAMQAAKSSFVIKSVEEPRAVTAIRLKRLIKKN